MEEFFQSKISIYIITFLLFLVIGVLLRFLFGPKGIFKEKNLTYGNKNTSDE